MKERDVTFFRPLWRRVAVVTVCAVWAALELWHGEQTWILITIGLTAYSVWTFFINFPKDVPVAATLPPVVASVVPPAADPVPGNDNTQP